MPGDSPVKTFIFAGTPPFCFEKGPGRMLRMARSSEQNFLPFSLVLFELILCTFYSMLLEQLLKILNKFMQSF